MKYKEREPCIAQDINVSVKRANCYKGNLFSMCQRPVKVSVPFYLVLSLCT